MTLPCYRNPQAPVGERVNDLLDRMTIEEKARQLDMFMGCEFVDRMRSNTQIATDGKLDSEKCFQAVGELGCGVIHDLYPVTADVANDLQRWFRHETRLGIPPLLVEEALHGFSRPDSTVFPQCIGLGATFDMDLVERIGAAVAAELRSVGVHLSLSPVLCLARDPRWGRAEETFGEDPWLVGRLGLGYCRGMQGELGPLNIVAEPKHFAGHGSPQSGLNQAPLSIGQREMREVMLKAFEPAFLEGHALAAMCAYHEIDGIPCSANSWLLTDLLREEWGGEGVVISDLGSIRQLYDKHRVAGSKREAICMAITAGVDIQFYDFDHGTWLAEIVGAVRDNELNPTVLDRAVGRVLSLKYRLGLFDNPETDTRLHQTWTRCESHLNLSLEAARKSLVLLKNKNQALPLSPDLQRVAVIGPSATVARFGDYSGIGDGNPCTILESLRSLQPQTKWVFEKGTDIDAGDLQLIPSSWLSTPAGTPGLLGAYMADGRLDSPPTVERIDSQIDFNWAIALAAPGMPADNFAVRWAGTLTPDQDLDGRIGFVTPDAVRVWLDEELVIDNWSASERGPATTAFPVVLRANEPRALRIEWLKCGGGSVVLFGYQTEEDGIAQATAAAQTADLAILCIGESDRTCGEGIDRAELGLPGMQSELFDAIRKTGTPIVVVLQNGRPLAIPDVKEHADAILEAWYPGEFGGKAIAEVLLGQVNPSGRLPVSIPRHVGQLPCFYNRKPSRQGRYVEMDITPLWPFGFGLSYTRFEYANLALASDTLQAGESLEISCTVSNVGAVEGEEVVQAYLSDPVASITRPTHWLAGCHRVHLQPGEVKHIALTIPAREMALWAKEHRWQIEAGEFRVRIGGGQDAPLEANFRVVCENGLYCL